ncbi:hypothetical protein R0J90_19450, partial [Micrococcus sp. SIMBA_144]
FECTIALKDAAKCGKRKQAIAQIFINQALQNDSYSLSELTLNHYELIIENPPIYSELQRT